MGEVIPIKPEEPLDLNQGLTEEFKQFASILLNPPKEKEESND